MGWQMIHRISIKVPYGRVVEFRKWRHQHTEIVNSCRLLDWEGSYGSPGHGRFHAVSCTEEKYLSLIKLMWHSE